MKKLNLLKVLIASVIGLLLIVVFAYASDGLTVSTQGNVGVGTTTPASKLNIVTDTYD